jgi:hypothetical protein
MEWFKSKFFWINAIALVVEIIQYFITNNLFPNITILLTSIIAILAIVSNAIAGTTISVRNAKLQLQVKTLTKKCNEL